MKPSLRSSCLERTLHLVSSKQFPSEALAELDSSDKKLTGIVLNEALLHNVDDILSRLPSLDMKILNESVKKMRTLGRGPFSKHEWQRIQHVFAMEILMCLHEISRASILKMVRQINLQLRYFEHRGKNCICDMMSNAYTYIEEASLSPIQAGLRPWLNSILFTRRQKLRTHVRKLRSIRKRLLRESALIHCRLHEMGDVNSFEMESSNQLFNYYNALYRQLEGADSLGSAKSSRKDILLPLAHLLSDSLPEFENRVHEYMDVWELNQPSHVAQYWPLYMAAASSVIALSQSPSAMNILAGGIELGKFALWDCTFIPFMRNVVSSWRGLARYQSGGDSVSAASSLRKSQKTLSVLLSDYEDKYNPETKSIMQRASNGQLPSIEGLKTSSDYESVIHGLLVQIQRLRIDLDSSMLQLVRLVEANMFAFSMMVALPASFIISGSYCLLKVLSMNSSARKRAARSLTRRIQRVESLLIHAPANCFDTADLARVDLHHLGEILHQVEEMDQDRRIIGGEIGVALEGSVTQLRQIGLDIETKLRILQNIHRANTLLKLNSAHL